jgi:hypothetical protein
VAFPVNFCDVLRLTKRALMQAKQFIHSSDYTGSQKLLNKMFSLDIWNCVPVAQMKILNCRIGNRIGITDWKAIGE